MSEFILNHAPGISVTILIAIIAGVLIVGMSGLQEMYNVEYECLSYGYPQYRAATGSFPAYCIRHIFDVDEVRTLDELRAKEKVK